MSKEYYFEMVEQVLKEFPLEYSKNYYKNKKTLVIEKKEMLTDSLGGTYDNMENTIDIYLEDSLSHELFHMAFRDPEKAVKKVWCDEEIYYSNGVSLGTLTDGHIVPLQKGLTEGFVVYLDKKCNNNAGKSLNYFFVDLLISIYGEDILKYPFQNDPIGFLLDERFYDIQTFSKNLDRLEECQTMIRILIFSKNTFLNILEKGNKEDCTEVLSIMDDTMNDYKSYIVSEFQNIINEYENYESPMISREEFIKKLESFLSDSDYEVAFGFDNHEFSVKDRIITIINDFKKEKSKLESMPWKIKKMEN